MAKHSFNYGFSDVLSAVIGFLLIPLYTRYLSLKDYGIVEITSTISAFCIPLMKLGLHGSVTRQYYEYKDNREYLNNYITTIHSLLNWSAIVIGLALLVITYFSKEFLFPDLQFFPFVVLAIISAGLSSNNQLQQRIIQNEEQSRYSLKLKTAFTLCSILMAILFVTKLKMGALGLILASLIVNFAFFIQAFFYLKDYLTGKFNKKMAKEGLTYGLGFLPHHLSSAVAPLINKTVLINIGTLASLGAYSIVMRFFLPLEIIYNMVNTAFVPIYNKYRKENKDELLKKNVRIIFMASLVFYGTLQLLGPILMKLMLPLKYQSSIPYLKIISIAYIFKVVYSICGAEIFYSQKVKFVALITISGLLVNTILCLLFLNSWGISAICWGFTSGFFVTSALSYVYKRKISDYDMFNKELIFFLAVSSVLTFITFQIY